MSVVEWKEPPPSGGPKNRSARHEAIAAELRANPGQWALVVVESHAGTAQKIRHSHVVAYRPLGAFEATCRRRKPDGMVEVYARFVGDPET